VRSKTAVAGAFVAAGLFLSGALAPLRSTPSEAVSPAPSTASGAFLTPSQSNPDQIATLAARLEARPDDAATAAALGHAYLREARDAAAPSLLPLAEHSLERSLQVQPDGNFNAYTGMAALANARHDFRGSVTWSRRAIAANPYGAAAYGLLGDALFELGRVRAADGAYQEMVSRRPDVASYVRASYALQHRGATRAAIAAMKLALQAAGPTGETAAWVRHQMGDVYAGLGRHGRAARENRIGAALAPGFVPPQVGLAESFTARGRLVEATRIMERAVAELPTLEYLTTLGNLYDATGRPSDAEEQYDAAAALLAEYRAAEVLPDADFVVFYADQGIRLGAALREARAIYRDRPTPKVAGALAWVLHATGDDAAAWRFAREAAAAPQRDATTLQHAATIARALGKDSAARTLERDARETMGLTIRTPGRD
jgi:tetratricopeptide (TPR) repeat protein